MTTSRIVHLLRHAHSSWAVAGQRDHTRPLDERGLGDARALAEHLRLNPPVVDRAVCSTAVRAARTFEAIRPVLAPDLRVDWSDDLYARGTDAYLAEIRSCPPGSGLLLVGHNPMIDDLLELLSPSGADALLRQLRSGVGTANWITLLVGAEAVPLVLAGLWQP